MVELEKFDEIVSTILVTDGVTLDDAASPETVEGWDSVSHIVLVSALEDEFGVSFSAEEMEELNTIGDLRHKIAEKLKGQQVD
jgi:acyl carrier protein